MKADTLKRILPVAFTKARAAALAADDKSFGGTCNCDACYLMIPRANPEIVQKAAIGAGVTVSVSEHRNKRAFFIMDPLYGQGDRRTHMAEATTKALKEALKDYPEIGVHTYYQVD
jgi:hypothetical protein